MTDRLTIADIRKAGFCVRGSLQHAELLGLDRRLLMREGLPLTDVENINDGNVQRSVAVARQRIADGQQ